MGSVVLDHSHRLTIQHFCRIYYLFSAGDQRLDGERVKKNPCS